MGARGYEAAREILNWPARAGQFVGQMEKWALSSRSELCHR